MNAIQKTEFKEISPSELGLEWKDADRLKNEW